jgi:hypothetical protein
VREVAEYVLQSSPSQKTLELFARYAILRDSLDRVSEDMFTPGTKVTDEKYIQSRLCAYELRDRCFDYLNWIRTGFSGVSTARNYLPEHTLH